MLLSKVLSLVMVAMLGVLSCWYLCCQCVPDTMVPIRNDAPDSPCYDGLCREEEHASVLQAQPSPGGCLSQVHPGTVNPFGDYVLLTMLLP